MPMMNQPHFEKSCRSLLMVLQYVISSAVMVRVIPLISTNRTPFIEFIIP